jgi:hypothetical protein
MCVEEEKPKCHKWKTNKTTNAKVFRGSLVKTTACSSNYRTIKYSEVCST